MKKTEYILETNDSYKKQIFDKKIYNYESYDEYTYICNPLDDKVGFKFVTREYYDESIREVFAFGKLNPNNTFKSVNSIFARKNSLLDAMILKSNDNENMPVGVQLITNTLEEQKLLNFAYALEQAK